MRIGISFLSGVFAIATFFVATTSVKASDNDRKGVFLKEVVNPAENGDYTCSDANKEILQLDEWKKEFPYSSKNPSSVARGLMSTSDKYCQSGVEGAIGIYQRLDKMGNPIPDQYYAANVTTDCEFGEVTLRKEKIPDHDTRGGAKLGKLVALMHNHPNNKRDSEGVMFSNNDVMAGLARDVDVYVGGCKKGDSWGNRALIRCDHTTGELKEVPTADGKLRDKNYTRWYRRDSGDEKGYLIGKDCDQPGVFCLQFPGEKMPDKLTWEDYEPSWGRKYYTPGNFAKMQQLVAQRKEQSTVQTVTGHSPVDATPVILSSPAPVSSANFDISKLETLVKEKIAILKDMLARKDLLDSGSNVTQHDIDSYNSIIESFNSTAREIMAELDKLTKQATALNLSEDEQKRISTDFEERLAPCLEEYKRLESEAKSKGIQIKKLEFRMFE